MEIPFAWGVAIALATAAGACGPNNPEPTTPAATADDTTADEAPPDSAAGDAPDPTLAATDQEPDESETARGELPPDCEAWRACINTMDDAMREASTEPFEQWRNVYMEATEEERAAIQGGCTQAMAALREAGVCP